MILAFDGPADKVEQERIAAADATSEQAVDIAPLLEQALSIVRSDNSKLAKKRELGVLEATPGAVGEAYRAWLETERSRRRSRVKKIAIGAGAVATVVVVSGVAVALKRPEMIRTALSSARKALPHVGKIAQHHDLIGVAGKGVARSVRLTPSLAKELAKQGLLFT